MKKPKINIVKPEVMESNMDAMEYSSEEEVEDLDTTMSNLTASKKKVFYGYV